MGFFSKKNDELADMQSALRSANAEIKALREKLLSSIEENAELKGRNERMLAALDLANNKVKAARKRQKNSVKRAQRLAQKV